MQKRNPTFREIRKRHKITLSMLYEDLLASGRSVQIHYGSIELFDVIGIGKVEVVDALLASLSRLTGQTYNRSNIGRIALLPSSDDE